MERYGIEFIKSCQRNRFPLLFVDEVTELEVGKWVKTRKNFTYNEWFFPAHFEGNPNVPGFVQLECLTQAFLMTFLTRDDLKGEETAFVSVEYAKFRRKIVPGETLEVTARLEKLRFGIASGTASGVVGQEPACEATLTVAVPRELNRFRPRTL